jgi:hypothetical protein
MNYSTLLISAGQKAVDFPPKAGNPLFQMHLQGSTVSLLNKKYCKVQKNSPPGKGLFLPTLYLLY